MHFLFEHESAEETPTSPYMDIDTLLFFSFVETYNFVYTRYVYVYALTIRGSNVTMYLVTYTQTL